MRRLIAVGAIAAMLATFAGGTAATWSQTAAGGLSITSSASFAPTLTAPVAAGATTLLSTLTSTPGTTGNSNVAPTIAYQWQYCPLGTIVSCVDIPGAAGTTFQITLAALGIAVLPGTAGFRVVETATNPWGATSTPSAVL
ncbi:MAG: hypothetical protein QOG68_2509 [Solirubrobacteraceae bacterium]|nr:hypothetical protein [Solirubrobacteraceae bacterium]